LSDRSDLYIFTGDDKGKTGKKRATLYMVTPYMDHDLSGMLTNPNIDFSIAQIKCYMQQLLEGLRYLHDVSSWPCTATALESTNPTASRTSFTAT